MHRIYLDNAASTAVDKRVVDSMKPYWNEKYGNAGGINHEAVEAKNIIAKSRKEIASYINAYDNEIIFTSCGTEGNNLAVFGVMRELDNQGIPIEGMHIITTTIEHSSILDIFKYLEDRGAEVSYIPVDGNGLVNVEDVKNEIKDNTVLVSIIMVNNEIGVVQPIEEIGKVISQEKKKRDLPVYFHTDASQAALFFKIDVKRLNADLITFDAQKMYGPKGVGFLYKQRDVKLQPLFIGGNQEFGLRPGTPNTPLIVGFHKAFELVEENRDKYNKHMMELRDYFISELEKLGATLNGDKLKRAPNNINVSFKGVDAEFFVVSLDEKGIACATKSACLGPDAGTSYVINALGKTLEESSGSVRFSISKYTTKKEIDFTLKEIAEVLKKS